MQLAVVVLGAIFSNKCVKQEKQNKNRGTEEKDLVSGVAIIGTF